MSYSGKSTAGRVVHKVLADGTPVTYSYGPHVKKAKPRGKTIGAMLEAWQMSPRWNKLAETTKRHYLTNLRHICDKDWLSVPVKALDRPSLMKIRDRVAKGTGNSAARSFCTTVQALCTWGLDNDWLSTSPAFRLTVDLPQPEAHEPWSEDELQLALRHVQESVRRAAILLVNTGQRIGDVCRMKWGDIQMSDQGPKMHVVGDSAAIRRLEEDGLLKVVQKKTGVRLLLPIPPPLAVELPIWQAENRVQRIWNSTNWKVVELRQLPKGDNTTILVTDQGRPWSPQNLAGALRRELEKVPGFPMEKGKQGLYPARSAHGLRYLAAIRLAEAECNPHEIMAVTGHQTLAMVQKYTAAADQPKLARRAYGRLHGSPANRNVGRAGLKVVEHTTGLQLR